MICSARLGCIPREQELVDWGGGDADSDGDTDTERDAGWPALDDCPQGDDCCVLLRACEREGESELCARYQEVCEGTNDSCGEDGDCLPGCLYDPDCLDPDECSETCGPVPDVSEERCRWSCASEAPDWQDCSLIPVDEEWAAAEECEPADRHGVDEDCNGLADCDDPACQKEGYCPEQ